MQNRSDRAKTSKPQRIGILVLGMHRAGTSCTTRLLSLLGADLPATLIGASQHNQSGYWESRAVRAFNDRLLTSAGSRWNDWRAVNAGWLDSAKAQEFKDEAADLLQAEIGSSRFFVLKDPRICRLAPFWFDVLEAADVTPHVVCVLRNPLEVAASLTARNGFAPEFSHLLWLRHMLDAEALSRGRPRAFLSYDRLLRGWGRVVNRAGEALGLSWPRGPEQIAEEVAGFLSDEKRHHHHGLEDVVENPLLPAWLRDTYRILDTWSAEGENPKDYPALDAVRAEMGATGLAFAQLITLGQKAAEDLRGRDEVIGKLTTAGQEARDRTATLEADLAALAEKMEEGRVKRLRLASDQEEAVREAAKLRAELAQAEAGLAAARSAAGAAETAAAQRLESVAAAARTRLANAETALTATRAELAEAVEAAAALRADHTAQAEALTAAEAEAATLAAALAEAEAARAALAEADEIKARRIGELKASRNTAEANVTRLNQALETETAARNAAEAGAAALAKAAAAEAARLTAALEAETEARSATETRLRSLTEAAEAAEARAARLKAALEAETAARSAAEAGAATLAEAAEAEATRLTAALEAENEARSAAEAEAAALAETAAAEAARLTAALEAETAARSTAEAGAATLAEAAAAEAARLTAALEAETAARSTAEAGAATLAEAAAAEATRLTAALEAEAAARSTAETRAMALAEADAARTARIDALHAAQEAAEAAAAALRDQLRETENALSQRRAETEDANRALEKALAELDHAARLHAEQARRQNEADAALHDAKAGMARLQQAHAAAVANGKVHEQVAARIEAQLQPLIREIQDNARQHGETEAGLRAEKAMLQRDTALLTESHEARLNDTVQLTDLLRLAEQDQQAARASLLETTGRLTVLEADLAAQRKAHAGLEAALRAAEAEQTRLAERNAQIEAAARRQAAAETGLEAELRAERARSEAAEAQQVQVQAEHAAALAEAARRLAEAEAALAGQSRAQTGQTGQAEPQAAGADRAEADRQYIRDALASRGRGRFLTKGARLRRQMAALRATGLFDAEWYLKVNTDVAEAGADPLKHFILYGLAEGRPPNPGSTRRS